MEKSKYYWLFLIFVVAVVVVVEQKCLWCWAEICYQKLVLIAVGGVAVVVASVVDLMIEEGWKKLMI